MLAYDHQRSGLCILQTIPKKLSPLHTARVKKIRSISLCEKDDLEHIKEGTKIPAKTGLCTVTLDVEEIEMINELRSPLDFMKLEDVEWDSSDHMVLTRQDGAVRLAGTSSNTLAYAR